MIVFSTLAGEEIEIVDIREQAAFLTAVSSTEPNASFHVHGIRYFARCVAKSREIGKIEEREKQIFGKRGLPFENKRGRPKK